MADMTMSDLAEKMRGIDIAMFATRTEGGRIASRPMSNNGDVEYDGDSWFFTFEESRTVRDIEADPQVELAFSGNKSLLGKPGVYVSVQGDARLIRDKAAFEQHWTKDVERYFEEGVDTPGVVLINVHASRIHYWDGEEDGEIRV